jgi:hypothetical protein
VRFFHTAPLIAVTIFTAAAVRQKTAPFSIVAIFLVFVPSLSWQIIAFHTTAAQQNAPFLCPAAGTRLPNDCQATSCCAEAAAAAAAAAAACHAAAINGGIV